ncbi:MAG: hypothetical protein KAU31_14580, partial [Spirochaetaceae bacterium]|nr:hypothetical protein [Spirochaetaceae bacterium]
DAGLNRLRPDWTSFGSDAEESANAFEATYQVDGLELARTRMTLSEPSHGGWQELRITCHVRDDISDLPRIGIRFELPQGFEQLSWYGRGPHESYPDRANGARVGMWKSSVAEQYVPYIVPQEHGGHSETRHVCLTERSAVFEVAAQEGETFHFSALHTAPEDLDWLTHTWQIKPRTQTILIVDFFHRGIGTAACGPDCHPRYRRGGGTVERSLFLRI